MVPGPHQQVINSLQASLNQAGHIILAGGDTAQLNSKYYRVVVIFSSFVFIRQFQTILLTLLHSERPKLHAILAFLSAIGLIMLNSPGMLD